MTIGTASGLVAAPGTSTGAGARGGGLEQPASNPRIAAGSSALRTFDMWVLFLEAFGAVLLLVLIVWWTMFHGRRNGERDDGGDS
ncbi:MAG TPA: hypothetical protein VNU48_10275 [Burkholderiaceae bacterium]|nr:hypothetical protein [Burkholderiaceae bacterium]